MVKALQGLLCHRVSKSNTRRLSGLKYELVCRFKLVADMVGAGIKEFVYDGLAFLKRDLVGFGVDGYR